LTAEIQRHWFLSEAPHEASCCLLGMETGAEVFRNSSAPLPQLVEIMRKFRSFSHVHVFLRTTLQAAGVVLKCLEIKGF
jgi:hypothetical protein